ncbi:DNA repair protein RecO [Rhabdothermincola sediminis]|uniref:DNA repair protein RecO n=1 Tax=Rhabdothermincola sediminis TaxID=2751370 RepID=UPI001AA03A8B|nr:DNA repair protein RecO [Rhabdothermincola sediminis]
MNLYRDTAVVLRTYKLGEADRIVVLMTQGRGKVRAVAKGVRKTRSKFGARLEPTSHVAMQLYQGRELDIVTQAESIDHFRSIRDDLDRIAKASAMLEAVDQLSQEGEPNPQLYQMLLGALRSLAAQDSPLVVPAFFLKALALEGYRPVVEHCASCGSEGPLVAFDLGEGGLLCQGCRRGQAVSAEAVALLEQVLGGQLGAALATAPSAATHEIHHLATRALEHHLERRLRSITLLDRA